MGEDLLRPQAVSPHGKARRRAQDAPLIAAQVFKAPLKPTTARDGLVLGLV